MCKKNSLKNLKILSCSTHIFFENLLQIFQTVFLRTSSKICIKFIIIILISYYSLSLQSNTIFNLRKSNKAFYFFCEIIYKYVNPQYAIPTFDEGITSFKIQGIKLFLYVNMTLLKQYLIFFFKNFFVSYEAFFLAINKLLELSQYYIKLHMKKSLLLSYEVFKGIGKYFQEFCAFSKNRND